jgi:capsular polysaccharide biosynthesis protein
VVNKSPWRQKGNRSRIPIRLETILIRDISYAKPRKPKPSPAKYVLLNQISFHNPPEDLIVNPFDVEGFALLRKPEFLWRARSGGQIHGFAASEHPEVTARIEAYLTTTQRHRAFTQVIEFSSVPVLLSDVWFKKSFVTTQNKCLISGASGLRLLNHYCWKNEKQEVDPEKALVDYFHQAQIAGEGRSLPIASDKPPAETAFAIECRNTFNYYHFITESLCQLCLVAEAGVEGPIYFHYPNSDDKMRLFAFAFIDALFPELADRVIFQRAPFHHDQVIVPYNFGPSYYHLPSSESEGLDAFAPSSVAWRGRDATRASHRILSINSVDSSLYALRDRALLAIEGKDFSYLPRRFWVGRESGQARSRDMKGENEIFEMLGLFGFEHVAFEKLTPLEQIAIMANAEVMISYHGAGFTNMLFAAPTTTVVELGTLQTAELRWGDFWRLANASQCRYVSFFADYHSDTPLLDPVFTTDSLVPVYLSPGGLAQVMSFVVSLLGHAPELMRARDIRRVTAQLIQVGAHHQARAVIERNALIVANDLESQTMLAACCEAMEDGPAQLAALYSAYRADPNRWQTLVSVIWCARKLNDLDTVRTALVLFRESFPQQFANFSKDRPWIKAQTPPLVRQALQ